MCCESLQSMYILRSRHILTAAGEKVHRLFFHRFSVTSLHDCNILSSSESFLWSLSITFISESLMASNSLSSVSVFFFHVPTCSCLSNVITKLGNVNMFASYRGMRRFIFRSTTFKGRIFQLTLSVGVT
jgi:hypothetical protein